MTSRLSLLPARLAVCAVAICAWMLAIGCTGAKRAASPGTVATADSGGKAGSGDSAAAEKADRSDAAPAAQGADEAPAPVVHARTATATVQPFVESLTAIGVVAARPGRYAELSAPAPTRVTRIFVGAGDVVSPGAPLVEFDRAPFDAAAASATAMLTVAQHAYDRAQRLAAAGIVPRKDVDQAAADLAQAQSSLVTARRAQELSTLRSPLSGVVTHLSAILGAAVDPAQPVVGVADPSALDIVLSLSPSDGARVRPRDSIAVTAGQGGPSGEPLGTGLVTAVNAALDTASRTLAVRARMVRPTRALRIGETVSGRITVAVHPRAIVVPVQALVPDGDQLKVFVVGKDGLAHARSVTVGGRTETLAEITDGLRPGEVVVTEGAYGVEDSAKVVPVT